MLYALLCIWSNEGNYKKENPVWWELIPSPAHHWWAISMQLTDSSVAQAFSESGFSGNILYRCPSWMAPLMSSAWLSCLSSCLLFSYTRPWRVCNGFTVSNSLSDWGSCFLSAPFPSHWWCRRFLWAWFLMGLGVSPFWSVNLTWGQSQA